MTVEDRLRSALQGADTYTPSPDLFAKVRGSIEDDRARRRRVLRMAAAVTGGLVAAAAWVLALRQTGDDRALTWWSVEILTTAILVSVVATLGPLIRRFGKTYTSDVFRSNPDTGARFLALLDVAYYLVFSAYVVLWSFFEPSLEWLGASGLDDQIQDSIYRVGGLLLVMGVLHAVTLFVLPLAGLVFASTRHRTLVGETNEEWEPEVRRAHRAASIVLWVAAVPVGLVLAVLSLRLLVFGLSGG